MSGAVVIVAAGDHVLRDVRTLSEADLVVARHDDGTFEVVKHRHGSRVRAPWDRLPAEVKRALRGLL